MDGQDEQDEELPLAKIAKNRKEAPPALSSRFYAKGVKLQSPVSRSAHWVRLDKNKEPQRGSTKGAGAPTRNEELGIESGRGIILILIVIMIVIVIVIEN